MKRLFAVFGLIGLIGCDSTIYSTDAFAEPRIEARDSYCHFSYDPADADVELKVGDCHTYVDTRQGSGTVYAHARFTNTFHPLYGMEYLNEHAHSGGVRIKGPTSTADIANISNSVCVIDDGNNTHASTNWELYGDFEFVNTFEGRMNFNLICRDAQTQ